jgi:hypothetical protein
VRVEVVAVVEGERKRQHEMKQTKRNWMGMNHHSQMAEVMVICISL